MIEFVSDPVVRSPFVPDYFAFHIYVALCLAIMHDRRSVPISPDDFLSNAKFGAAGAEGAAQAKAWA